MGSKSKEWNDVAIVLIVGQESFWIFSNCREI